MQKRSSTQDISWFIDLNAGKQLDMDPPYQRRSVWTLKDRRFFLDTIFRGYPCPPIFLHKTINKEQQTQYAVVDGKQRLQTILQFSQGEFALAKDFNDSRFDGKVWKDLSIDERKIFWNYVVPVEFLTFDEKDTKEVSQAFDRLNRNMRKLQPQELRHAKWDGWFMDYVEKDVDDSFWKNVGISTNARTKRMKDAQFVSELLLLTIEKQQVGFDQETLDEAYGKYDEIDSDTVSINTDDVTTKWEGVKSYIREMQADNSCITDYANTFARFYTLWALIVLHGSALPSAKEMAPKFEAFMREVDNPQTQDARCIAFRYASAGASTDLGPRMLRLENMLAYITK